MSPAPTPRVVLASVGSRGDVQPMLALAQALAARGHVPVIAVPPNFEPWVKALGFEFAPLGADMQVFLAENADLLTSNQAKALRGTAHYFSHQIPLQAQQLRSICRGADALLWSGLAFVAPSVAEHLRLPSLGVLYSTCMVPSGLHPPPTFPWHGLPNWVNHFFWRIQRLVASRIIGAPLNAQRVAMGLPPVGLHQHLFRDSQFVIAVDEALFPPDPSWGRRFPYANYIAFDDPEPLDPDLVAWLANGEPPVFVGFGSMSGHGTDRIEQMIVEAVSATGRRCIVGAGWAGLGEGHLPPGWRVVSEAPHAKLFPRVAAVVHHGGSGTTASALRAGVAQVILPLFLDQYHHAHRLFVAGIAPRPVPMERITAPELTQAIQAALALPQGPRMAAAGRLRASDACADIARRLETRLQAAGLHPARPGA